MSIFSLKCSLFWIWEWAKKERTNENVADLALEFWHGMEEVVVDPFTEENNGKINTTTRSPIG